MGIYELPDFRSITRIQWDALRHPRVLAQKNRYGYD